jgi:hypothetical protein
VDAKPSDVLVLYIREDTQHAPDTVQTPTQHAWQFDIGAFNSVLRTDTGRVAAHLALACEAAASLMFTCGQLRLRWRAVLTQHHG